LSPSTFEEVSVITLVALALAALTFFIALIVVIFTALTIAICQCFLSTTIVHPLAACLLSADAGAAAASHPPVEPLLPLVALYFIMTDCYVVISTPAPSSHCCSRGHCCHCIVIVSRPAALTEETLQKKKSRNSLFLITAQNGRYNVQTGLFSKSKQDLSLLKPKEQLGRHPILIL
jgi:hypothetical protein